MSQFFSPPGSIKGGKIFIEGEEAHHILQVMRLKVGDRVSIFDGQGNIYQGVIVEERKKSAVVNIVSKKKEKFLSKPAFCLAQGIPARNKMDYLIEKATELGVDSFFPLETKRSVVRVDKNRAEATRKRWERIAISASKQCGRLKLPVINPIIKFSEFLKRIPEFDLVLFACLDERTVALKNIIKNVSSPQSILVFIGPEGDFTPEEIKLAKVNGCNLISLGANVLKSDTAGLAVLAILQYEYNRN